MILWSHFLSSIRPNCQLSLSLVPCPGSTPDKQPHSVTWPVPLLQNVSGFPLHAWCWAWSQEGHFRCCIRGFSGEEVSQLLKEPSQRKKRDPWVGICLHGVSV